MLCMNQRTVQTIFGGPKMHASVKNHTISERNEFSMQIYRSISKGKVRLILLVGL